MLEPRLLILDETLSALDQVEQSRLLEIFDKLQAEHGFTYIFISHDLAMVRRACTRGDVSRQGAPYTVFFDATPARAPTMRSADAEENLLEGPPTRSACRCSFNSLPARSRTAGRRRGDGRISACYWANASENELAAACAGLLARPGRRRQSRARSR